MHNVRVAGLEVSSVYIHFSDTHLTPCVELGELISAGGMLLEKNGGNTYVYTRSDKLTLGVENDMSDILIYKGGEVVKRFPCNEYRDAEVYGEYLVMSLSGDKVGVGEVYKTKKLEKLFDIDGTVCSFEDDRITTCKNVESDGEFVKKYFVYDLFGKVIETYVDNR